ncbi:MAG TPA: M1 family aminopeptidase [Phycisphaerae bacterium]|nr:M1 family aminopeptidase [Phycisphaerae bacterium]
MNYAPIVFKWRRPISAACVAWVLGSTASFVFAQDGHDVESCDEPVILGCGKAQALAAAHAAQDLSEPVPGLREAMTETDVLHHTLDIEISNFDTVNNHCTIAGSNATLIESNSPALTQYTFRLRNQYVITSVIITDEFGGNPVDITAGLTTPSTTTRVVTLDQSYAEGERFIITISYNGSSESRGFGSIDVKTQSGTPVVATLSEAYYAYTWWPCKDGDVQVPGDNSDKFTMDFYLTAPNNYVVPSNGLQMGAPLNLGGGRLKYHWHTDYPISTYLVSFAATNYTQWSQTYNYPGGTMPVEFYIYPGNDTPGNRTAWENVINMLAVFRTVYGEYPFINEKYGHYNFNFGGGMEHQTITGLGTFSESTIAHELGHQWWGDMITCKNWNSIYLNEGFATYSECLWYERKVDPENPDFAAYKSAILARKPSSAGGTVYVSDAGTASMNTIFSSDNSYRKGAWVLHMLRGAVGDAAFFEILTDYRAAFEFSAASAQEFASLASASSGQDLSTFFDQWVMRPGAPTYQYGWQSVNVNSQNYLLAHINQTQTTTDYPKVFEMPVPLRLTIGGSPQTVTVMNDGNGVLEVPEQADEGAEWFVVPVSGNVTALAFDPDEWILRVATPSSVAYVPGPPKIVQTVPAPGAGVVQTISPSQLTVWFHTPVNTANAHYSLVGDVNGPQTVSIVSGANVNPVVINTAAPLPPDNYSLTVTSGGVTAVNSGLALDGEVADPLDPASLPSGDGTIGGNAVIRFEVTPCSVLADIDADCDKDPIDIDLFVDVLLENDTDPGHMARSDVNNSGLPPDALDIQPFIDEHLTP